METHKPHPGYGYRHIMNKLPRPETIYDDYPEYVSKEIATLKVKHYVALLKSNITLLKMKQKPGLSEENKDGYMAALDDLEELLP